MESLWDREVFVPMGDHDGNVEYDIQLQVKIYLLHLQQLGLAVTDEMINGDYSRWCGDSIELNRGEILMYDQPG